MEWSKRKSYLPKFEWASRNQHGDRFKRLPSKEISMVTLTAGMDSTADMQQLLLLSHHLDVPVTYNFGSPNTASIEIAGVRAL